MTGGQGRTAAISTALPMSVVIIESYCPTIPRLPQNVAIRGGATEFASLIRPDDSAVRAILGKSSGSPAASIFRTWSLATTLVLAL